MLTERITDEMAGWAGIVGIGIATVTIVASVLLFDGFDWAVHDLSTLAHVDKEIAADSRFVFSGGLIVTALFGFVFAVGLFRVEDRLLWKSGVVMYVVSHLILIWISVFPAGTPQHGWLSVFPAFVWTVLVIGVDQFRHPETRLFGIAVLSNFFVGVLGAALLLQTDIEGWAIHETLGVTVFSILTLLYAARLLGLSGMTVGDGGDDSSAL
jgi:hypothetical membrane protein